MSSAGTAVPVLRLGDLLVDSCYGTSKAGSPSGSTPVVGIPHVRDGKVRITETSRIDLSEDERDKLALRPGDILLIRTNGNREVVGQTGLVETRTDAVFASYLVRLRVDTSRVVPEYLNHWLNSPGGRREVRQVITEAGQANVNPTELQRMVQVPLPSLERQRFVATSLGTWDASIAHIDSLSRAKLSRRDALLERLFDTAGDEWRELRLGDIGELSGSGVDKRCVAGESPALLANFLDVMRCDFLSGENLTQWVTAPVGKLADCSLERGDILFTPSSEIRGDIARSAVVIEDIPSGVYSYHIVRLRMDDDWDLAFRAYAFKTSQFYRQAYRLCEGSGQRYVLNLSTFRRMTVRVPPVAIQRRIGEALRTADAEIRGLGKLGLLLRQQRVWLAVTLFSTEAA